MSLIYSNILCMIWNGNVLMQKKLIRKIIEKMASYLCATKILQKSGIQKNEVIELIYRGFI